MKAVLHTRYGPPDELQLREIEKPVPKPNEVLIRIHASTVTTSDCNIRNLTFVPGVFRLPTRMQFGMTTPVHKVLGMDLAGEIEAVGAHVMRFKAGDRVFGTTEPLFGAHAEYICLPENAVLATMPARIGFKEAATYPVMANTALHYIRDLGKTQRGQHVLINGASGGIGVFAVQLATYYGARVTGVCSTRNVDLVRSLGADMVIDYTKDDFTSSSETYDIILDAPAKSSFTRCKDSLKPGGAFLATLPTPGVLFDMMWTGMVGSQKVKMQGAPPSLENLLTLKELIEEDRLRTVIDRTYPLEQTAEAFRCVEQGHKRGSVVISIRD